MCFRFLICLLLAAGAAFLTRAEAVAGDSAGSYGGYSCYGSLGVFRDGDGYALPRRDIRIARREARQADRQARWGGSSGSYGCTGRTSYGSAGSTSYAVPVVAVDYCPAEVEPLTVETEVQLCPTGDCPRRLPLLGGNRRNPIFN